LTLVEPTKEGAEAFRNYAIKLRKMLEAVEAKGERLVERKSETTP